MTLNSDGRPITRRRPQERRRVRQAQVSNTGFGGFEQSPAADFTADPVECYKFVVGATTFRYTSADRNVTLALLDSGIYAPTVITRGEIDFSQEDTAENVTVKLYRTDAVAQLFVAYNSVSPVSLTIYRKQRSDPEETIVFTGKVVTVSYEGPEASLICAPTSEIFRRRVPALAFQSQCAWALYGTGCGISKAAFKDSGTVLAVAGSTLRAAVFATRPDGWYTNGWAELANGDRRFITDHAGDAVTLQNQFPSTLAVGASVDAFAGCDRTEATCTSKFNNLVHHLGFPRIPTRNPFEGSIV